MMAGGGTRGRGVAPGRARLPLLAVAVHLACAAAAFGGGDGLMVCSGGAELRSAAPREVGKVPVVFVHGMLGSPANWSPLIERLSEEPRLLPRFQFLTFGYDSLQSIPESGRELLELLDAMRRRCDPDGLDDSFDRIVLAGHSLGGLVAKEAAAHSRAHPPADGAKGARVGRLIFIATPHHGSPVDRGAVRSVGTRLARALSPTIAARVRRGDASGLRRPTSVDQLTWDHPLLRDLGRACAAASIPYHSIIACLGAPDNEGATDGLVPVASAHLDGARSELVVRTHHVCFGHAEVIREVRRVLLVHAEGRDGRPRPGPGPTAPPPGPPDGIAAVAVHPRPARREDVGAPGGPAPAPSRPAPQAPRAGICRDRHPPPAPRESERPGLAGVARSTSDPPSGG